ncbi:coiled-coil domain-containing protein 83 isoform X2 [Silurus meridionalis]|uniref:coiled-coil domain-containing protein 83 isoform X2 n=1 Tax=Silurus meridionalis TaxID=175797 RepID=UPI001EEA9494|nr:coiled-coil domain-containing protein 83 isoform X2 [Silurus meridionalis]
MGKKTKEKKVQIAEAFIQLQIEVKMKEIEEFENEIKELEAKKQRLVELRDQLQKEQRKHFCGLNQEVRKHEKVLNEEEIASEKQIKQALRHNRELMHTNQEELTESLLCFVEDATCKLEKEISQVIEQVKEHATEIALKEVDKHNLKETENNLWLKTAIATYNKEVSELEADVTNLQEENLEHMKYLSECRYNDFKMSRNTFLTETEDLLENLSISESPAEIEKKPHQQSRELEEDKMDRSCMSSSRVNLRELLYSSQSQSRELLHLGPSDQNLLSVVGQAMPLHSLPTESEEMDMLTHLSQLQAEDGTLTRNMVRQKFQ